MGRLVLRDDIGPIVSSWSSTPLERLDIQFSSIDVAFYLVALATTRTAREEEEDDVG